MTEIRDAALEYLDQGFSVIPIRPGPEKKPYCSWTEFQRRRPSEEEIHHWWERWPRANVAIITGSISGIFVVDGDGEIGSRWIAENLPKTTVYAKTGRAAGCHCYYRLPPGTKIPNRVGWRPKVDLRGEGGYVIAPPSIHHTGAVYQLIYREGLRGWEELPQFNPLDMAKNTGNLMLDLSGIRTPEQAFEPVKKGERNASLASLLGKLFRAGMAPEQTWEYITEWNRKNDPPIGERELKATFRSILRRHQMSGALIIEPIASPESPEDQTDAIVRGPMTDTYPIGCLQPGGLLQEIMTYVEKSSSAHKPVFALGAAIAILGNVLGQRVQTETGLRTNMYCVAIGYSGCGKNASHSAIAAILRNSLARSTLGPTDTASGAAILKWLSLEDHAVTLLTLDEIGMLLKGLKNPGSPMCELPRMLTKIFSETDRPYSKSYADAKLNITIPWHHLTLYASSTPGQFWGNLTEADAASGFLARILIFEARDEAERPRPVTAAEVPEEIKKRIDALWTLETPIDPARGDIARVPVPRVIPRTFPAQQTFAAWSEKYFDLRNKYREDEAAAAVYGRAAEHAAKLALIHAFSMRGEKTAGVGEESIEWAAALVDACVSALVGGIRENIAKNTFHSQQQEFLRALTAAGGEASLRAVFRRLHLPVRQGQEILQSLLLSGEIRQEERKGLSGPPAVWVISARR